MGQLIYLKDVVTLDLDQAKCVGCGTCTLVCPHAVLNLTNGKAMIQNRDLCIECGACATNCQAEAITVRAGVGCAAALINTALGRKDASSCCVIDPSDNAHDQVVCPEGGKDRTPCC